jgi:Arc/MetJ family transcription regulator
MATNLDVDQEAIAELMRLGGFRSKREAVDAAVAESVAWRRQLKSSEVLATIDFRSVALPASQGPATHDP